MDKPCPGFYTYPATGTVYQATWTITKVTKGLCPVCRHYYPLNQTGRLRWHESPEPLVAPQPLVDREVIVKNLRSLQADLANRMNQDDKGAQ